MEFSSKSFQFLEKLAQNNNREWFATHKNEYEEALKNAKSIFKELHQKLAMHDEIEKASMLRIYRDVRFSKDKTPYKPQFAGSFSRLGKERRGGYFVRIKPGESLVAGGFWEPNKDDLYRIRKEIEQDATEIKQVLQSDDFKNYFNGEFQSFEELKTAPNGFDKNHPEIHLLRKKGFIAVRNLTDDEVLSPNFMDEVDKTFQALRPFFDLFSDILTTNLNGESIL